MHCNTISNAVSNGLGLQNVLRLDISVPVTHRLALHNRDTVVDVHCAANGKSDCVAVAVADADTVVVCVSISVVFTNTEPVDVSVPVADAVTFLVFVSVTVAVFVPDRLYNALAVHVLEPLCVSHRLPISDTDTIRVVVSNGKRDCVLVAILFIVSIEQPVVLRVRVFTASRTPTPSATPSTSPTPSQTPTPSALFCPWDSFEGAFCSGHGVCSPQSVCQCTPGHFGDACQHTAPDDPCAATDACPTPNAVCLATGTTTKACVCRQGFTGAPACTTPVVHFFEATTWSPCSAPCGGGTSQRTLSCRRVAGMVSTAVPVADCLAALEPQAVVPATTRLCNVFVCGSADNPAQAAHVRVYFAFDVTASIGASATAFDALLDAVLNEVALNVGVPLHRVAIARFDVAARLLTFAFLPAGALAPAQQRRRLQQQQQQQQQQQVADLTQAPTMDVAEAFMQTLSGTTVPPGSWMVRMTNATVTQEGRDGYDPSAGKDGTSTVARFAPFVAVGVVALGGVAALWIFRRRSRRKLAAVHTARSRRPSQWTKALWAPPAPPAPAGAALSGTKPLHFADVAHQVIVARAFGRQWLHRVRRRKALHVGAAAATALQRWQQRGREHGVRRLQELERALGTTSRLPALRVTRSYAGAALHPPSSPHARGSSSPVALLRSQLPPILSERLELPILSPLSSPVGVSPSSPYLSRMQVSPSSVASPSSLALAMGYGAVSPPSSVQK